jgi:hypothetical protein
MVAGSQIIAIARRSNKAVAPKVILIGGNAAGINILAKARKNGYRFSHTRLEIAMRQSEWKEQCRSTSPEFFSLLAGSYQRLLRRPLALSDLDPRQGAPWLDECAPFALLAQNAARDPVFVYANLT